MIEHLYSVSLNGGANQGLHLFLLLVLTDLILVQNNAVFRRIFSFSDSKIPQHQKEFFNIPKHQGVWQHHKIRRVFQLFRLVLPTEIIRILLEILKYIPHVFLVVHKEYQLPLHCLKNFHILNFVRLTHNGPEHFVCLLGAAVAFDNGSIVESNQYSAESLLLFIPLFCILP